MLPIIKAVLSEGRIQSLDAIPSEWHEGDELLVSHSEQVPTLVEIAKWAADVEAAAAKVSDEDHGKAMAVIALHREEAKKQPRRELGLTE